MKNAFLVNDRWSLSLRLGESRVDKFFGRLDDCNFLEIISKRHAG